MDETGNWWIKLLLLISSLVCTTVMLVAALHGRFSEDWRRHQQDYRRFLVGLTQPDEANEVDYPVEIRQVYLQRLDRVDRCVSCHVGIENPACEQAEQPLTAHPGDLLEHHPTDRFGCTICHQGQGRATTLADAHGRIEHWPEPMHAGNLVYTSCGQCHYENDLYGGTADLYGQSRPVERITQGELQTDLPGADNVARGKQLVIQFGCLGCHKYRGRGGTLGPEITHVGDKTVHDFDFSYVAGPRTIENWMTTHFRSPAAVVPGTVMPDLGLSASQARDLAACMMSLKRKSAPAAYTPLPLATDRTPAGGEQLYDLYCSACHGSDGLGATVRVAQTPGPVDQRQELMTPSLRSADTLAVASDDYLRWISCYGRAGTSMPAWLSEGGLPLEEIDAVVAHLRGWEPLAPPLTNVKASRGNPRYGRALYRSRCLGCHGLNGEGGIGVALRSSSLLSVATDQFLAHTIVQGRPNTAMPAWKALSADEVSDLLSYLRSWQRPGPERQRVLEFLAAGSPDESQARIGKTLYQFNCASCHGSRGQGAVGPSLSNNDFLAFVSDDYLFQALVQGHPGTAMPSWKHFSAENLAALIQHVRSFNHFQRLDLGEFHAFGDWQRGALLYQGACSGCHGPDGIGGLGPQLSNPVFLATVSDALLREWISHGRPGTQMRACLKGGFGMVELSSRQIEDIISYLRHLQDRPPRLVSRPGMGIVPVGAEWYAQLCASCHGAQGQGGTGSALANPSFLKQASDGFLLATAILGRDGTAMKSAGKGGQGMVELTADQLSDIVSFIRHWEHEPPVRGVVHRYVMAADLAEGRELYAGHCAGCHGAEGKQGWAPALNNPQFLTAASDGFLQATIALGRAQTAMRAFAKGRGGVTELSGDQIRNLTAYLRSWAPPDFRPNNATTELPGHAAAH